MSVHTPLIECVPNFSEGRDEVVIAAIREAIVRTPEVRVLHVDSGKDANRTVITFAGPPEAVTEAAFRGVEKAAERIDMRRHHGEHPRFGATDVCPLVPVAGISLEETAAYAHRLAGRIGEELGIPVFCYEAAAQHPLRKSLAACRAGEYEGLPAKLADRLWQPDYGPAVFNARSGAVAVGARNFLVAWNVNLDTDSVETAKEIAADIRESGRPATGHQGKPVRDAAGNTVRIPGTLKSVRAIGWYMKTYRCAQVSLNLTDLSVTSLHQAFEEIRRCAEKRGTRVTGSELIGLIPLRALLDAGEYFLGQHGYSNVPAQDCLLKTAVKSLGLDELSPFDPQERVLEFRLR